MSLIARAPRLLACALLYALLFGASLEACARLDDYFAYGAPLLRNYSMDDLKVVDATGIHGRPHARFENWQLNNLGFRGPDAPLTKPAGETRVLLLGASETFGLYESPGMEYPAQLERVLANTTGRNVRVLNGALPGMSLPRAIEFCRNRLKTLRPDVVVYYPTPASYLDEEAPALITGDSRRVSVSREAGGGKPSPRLLRRGMSLLKGVIPPAVQDRLRRREIDAAMRGKPEAWLFRDAPGERVRLFEQHLEVLTDEVRRGGSRLVLATHANRFGTNEADPSGQLLAWRKFYPRATGRALLQMEQRANEVVRTVARRRRILLADVANAVPRDPVNFQDFAHFTDRGATLAAAAFAGPVSKTIKTVLPETLSPNTD